MTLRVASSFLLGSLLLLSACPKTGPATEVKLSAPSGVSAPEGAVGATCFDACLKQLAMRAVAVEENERDCKARCESQCVPACVKRSAMRAVSAGQIDSDCRKGCGL